MLRWLARVGLLLGVLNPGSPSYGQGPGSTGAPITLALPNRGWALEIQAAGFATQRDETREDGNARYFYATNSDSNLNMSVLLEKTPSSQSRTHCRAYYWENLKKRSPLKMDDVRMSDPGHVAVLEYMVKQYQDLQVEQKNLNAYLAKDGVCVDIHLSKVQFRSGEESLFTAVLDGLRVAENVRAAQAGPAASPSVRSYAVPGDGALVLAVPRHWQQSVRQGSGGRPPTITLLPAAGDEFRVLISPWRPPAKTAPDKLREIVERQGQGALVQAVEKTLVLEDLKGPEALGYFYSLTDKAPKPGEYEYLTQGMATVGELVLTFTILTRSRQAPERGAALEMLKTARQRTQK